MPAVGCVQNPQTAQQEGVVFGCSCAFALFTPSSLGLFGCLNLSCNSRSLQTFVLYSMHRILVVIAAHAVSTCAATVSVKDNMENWDGRRLKGMGKRQSDQVFAGHEGVTQVTSKCRWGSCAPVATGLLRGD